MQVWRVTAKLVCTISTWFLCKQNYHQPPSTRLPISIPLLRFGRCCQLTRLGQNCYEELSLKMHKHVSGHFCSGSSLIKQRDFLFSGNCQVRNALFQRKLMNLANHILLHHEGEGKRKSLLAKWGASQQKATVYPMFFLFFNGWPRANTGQTYPCLPVHATAFLISRLIKYSMQFALAQTVLLLISEQQANVWLAIFPFPTGNGCQDIQSIHIEDILHIC